MDFNWKDIGQNIKLRRIKLKLKQSELAELVDVSSQHISHVECGKTIPSIQLMMKLSVALKADLNELLNIPMPSLSAAPGEFANLLNKATADQKKICLQICKIIIEHDS